MRTSAGRDLWTESSRAISLADIRAMSLIDIKETAKDIFFPAICPVCGDAIPIERRIAVRRLKRRIFSDLSGRNTEPLKKNESCEGSANEAQWLAKMRAMYPAYVCRECLGELEYIKAPYCKKCGKQLEADSPGKLNIQEASAENTAKLLYGTNIHIDEKELCSDCTKKERGFRQTRCVITYDETAQEIMAGLKYKSKREYAALLSLLAAERLSGWIKGISPDIIVPVPVHKERLLTRGYNQAELIARGISELTKIPLNTEILYRTKNTRAQKELTADERLYNLLGAFEADISFLNSHDITVLLVDDIYTTGATMEACTVALKYAGAKAVYGLCICAGRDAQRIQHSVLL